MSRYLAVLEYGTFLTVNSYWDVLEASVGRVNVNRFRFIKLDVPFFRPLLHLVEGCL
jgi:hypothetical protein